MNRQASPRPARTAPAAGARTSLHLYAVADIHGRPRRMEEIRVRLARTRPDFLVVAGDMAGWGRALPTVLGQLNCLAAPALVVGGNQDGRKVGKLSGQYKNVRNLHLSAFEVRGVRFVGVGGTLSIPFRTRLALREKGIRRALRELLTPETILVGHPPPRGVRDLAFGRFHVGSRTLREILEEHQPALYLCGHVHEQPGMDFVGRTLVVNCSVGKSGAGAVIEVQANGRIRAEMARPEEPAGD